MKLIMPWYRHRRLILFLVVLIIPTIAIVTFGWKIYGQARELVEPRKAISRKRAVEEIGQDMLALLKGIKLQEIANAPAKSYSDAAVVVVGSLDGDRLVLPWEGNLAAGERGEPSGQQRDFSHKLEEADRAQFVEQQLARAAELYNECINDADNESQWAAAQLALARSLVLSGAQPAAIEKYRAILKLPGTVADEFGLPFASYASIRLAEMRAATPDVLERANEDLKSLAEMTPIQAYRLRSVFEALRNSDDATVREGAGSALNALLASAQIRDMEEVERLQKDLQKSRLNDTDWQSYRGAELWLVGKVTPGAASRPLVIIVRGETIRRKVEADRLSREAGPAFQFTANADSGELLSPQLPGLHATLEPGASQTEDSPGPHLIFYALSLSLIFGVTFIGGYLLWRDTRRESHIAELRTQFVSSVSHELKTPLTSIRMFAEILKMRGMSDPQMNIEYLDTIVNESERLSRLLTNVLEFSRIERGQKTYQLEPAPLADVIRTVVRSIQFPLAELGFALHLDLADSLPPVVVDRDGIQQAVLNLLTNAMKYSGERRDIAVRLAVENGNALIQVADHGIGIPLHEQRHIFEKFYRAHVPENQAISGTGLGLALVAHVAEAHGGSVKVESRPGEGSTFSLRLPMNKPNTEVESVPIGEATSGLN